MQNGRDDRGRMRAQGAIFFILHFPFSILNSPPSIPDHTLLRPIGRGAYGEVWLAQNVMGAPRAVKIIWRRQFESDRPYEREFAGIQRFEPVSRSADGLVHVLHVGRNDAEGYFYYVMELADAEAEQVGKWESEKVGDDSASAISPAHFPTFSPASYTPRTLRSDLKRLADPAGTKGRRLSRRRGRGAAAP